MRNVIVTGASRGLGLAMARKLAQSGDHVVAVARSPSPELERAALAAGEAGGAVSFVAADLAAIDAIPELVRRIRKEFGPPFGLVNNAGVSREGLLATMHNSEIEAVVRLNTVSPMVMTKYVVRAMMAEGAGRIVNVSSIIGSTGYNGLAVYGATKASMIGFTKSLAREVGRVGITVNALAPGFMETELTGGLAEEDRRRIAGRSALRRLAEVEDAANAVAFLLSDAARNITGTVLTVDAGNTA